MDIDSREWAQIRNALDYYANPKNWSEDDWGVMSVLSGLGGYGRPTEKARRARQALGRLERRQPSVLLSSSDDGQPDANTLDTVGYDAIE